VTLSFLPRIHVVVCAFPVGLRFPLSVHLLRSTEKLSKKSVFLCALSVFWCVVFRGKEALIHFPRGSSLSWMYPIVETDQIFAPFQRATTATMVVFVVFVRITIPATASFSGWPRGILL
jgi:hypothetical protein